MNDYEYCWEQIIKVLNEVYPGWLELETSGIASAMTAIRILGTSRTEAEMNRPQAKAYRLVASTLDKVYPEWPEISEGMESASIAIKNLADRKNEQGTNVLEELWKEVYLISFKAHLGSRVANHIANKQANDAVEAFRGIEK